MTDYQPTPPPQSSYAPGAPVQRSPVLSIISLICGIVGVLLSLFAFGSGVLPGIAAIVLGFLGRSKEPQAKGMWLTGLILGFVSVVVAIIVWIVLGLIYAAAVHSSLNQ